MNEQSLFERMKELLRHTAVYGLGNLVARIVSVLLLPLYTRYLTPGDYGLIETLVALSAVLTALVAQAMKSAFFRFYFDSAEDDRRRRVILTAFWYVMAAATGVLALGVAFAGPISSVLFGDDSHSGLVIAAFVGLWAAMNYEQMTSMFRVEKRSGAYLVATLANLVVTVTATVLLLVVFDQGPLGVIVGNFTGTLIVYAALLVHRRRVLGFGFDRQLYRSMVRYGLPLVPSVLALWATNFSDRFFLVKLADVEEVGLYSIGARLASAIVIGLTAFRMGWPAFAYSIADDREAKRAYSFVMTYVIYVTCWAALALGALAPWLLQLITTEPFYAAENVVAPLAFATAAFGGYTVAVISVGRVRATRLNWAVTGAAAALNVALNFALIPSFGRMGAAFATLAAYSLMFAAMVWRAQTVFPVPYQWRRLATLVAVAVGLTVLAKAADVPLGVALALVAAYPLALIPLRFYLPAERARLRSLLPT
ncbi:MAG TPA: oligosaccharide flippase family protein [Gaiellaceae bacterium]|jgi:O-antigen/teichoic acid export membrane protein|nr:oligosaccharide flippase family protein [Gaiellaceae bacterium]